MKLIIGLGNPGEKYAKVRHNLGFDVLDELIKKLEVGGPSTSLRTSEKLETEVGSWKLDNKLKSEIYRIGDIILVKPQTYMNNSGMAVRLLSTEFGVRSEEIIIVHDELDLPLGKIKVRLGGAAAGHHGVESIIEALGTDQFIRVRLGIGNLRTQSSEHKHAHVNAEKFVLEPFMRGEKPHVKHMTKQAVRAVELLLEKGLKKAQNQYN